MGKKEDKKKRKASEKLKSIDNFLFGYQSEIYIGDAGSKGRGVFAARPIQPSDTIEISPMMLMKKVPEEFEDYVFEVSQTVYGLAMGYGSFYNHSNKPKAIYYITVGKQNTYLEVMALNLILPGEEITINYNGDPNDKTPWLFK